LGLRVGALALRCERKDSLEARVARMTREERLARMPCLPEPMLVWRRRHPPLCAVYPTSTNGNNSAAPVGILTFRLSISAAFNTVITAFEPVSEGLALHVLDNAAPRGQRLIYNRPTRTRSSLLQPGRRRRFGSVDGPRRGRGNGRRYRYPHGPEGNPARVAAVRPDCETNDCSHPCRPLTLRAGNGSSC
jgi:hypothetical protein